MTRDIAALPSYAPRAFHTEGDWSVADTRLKVYGIAIGDQARVAPDVIAAARAYTEQALPAVLAEEGGHGAGYVVIHAGEMANWLLIHWWAHDDICMRLLASAPPGSADFTSQDHRRFLACVWEMIVITHESNAWIRQMQSGAATLDGYFADRLPDGLY